MNVDDECSKRTREAAYASLKFQELLNCEPGLLQYLLKKVATNRVPTVYRDRSHALRYRMKIILMTPV